MILIGYFCGCYFVGRLYRSMELPGIYPSASLECSVVPLGGARITTDSLVRDRLYIIRGSCRILYWGRRWVPGGGLGRPVANR